MPRRHLSVITTTTITTTTITTTTTTTMIIIINSMPRRHLSVVADTLPPTALWEVCESKCSARSVTPVSTFRYWPQRQYRSAVSTTGVGMGP